ncbi:hypothetical protein MPH_02060 [Macrophomina phaseolina MS6]|uniref:Glycine-rich cell wall structural protein 1 n=1 Tax=Macrophomina phaseolina (strain MS6) TaxID=1126212 RepID=K2S0R6_MACPH|nr:hypothetical protein MPH_02060 [Macrophomina phaseolina MS6]
MAGKSAQEAHGGASDARVPSNPSGGETLVDRTKNFGASGDAQFPGGENKATGTGSVSSTSNPLGGSASSPNIGTSAVSNPGSGSSSMPSAGVNAASNPLSAGSTIPATASGAAAAQGGAIRPEHDTAGTGVTSLHSNDPHGSDVRPTEAGTSSAKAGGFGAAEPSVGADPTSGQQPEHKQQGGDKPTAEPTTGAEVDKVKEKKDEGEEALKKRDLSDHSGEPLKMHGDSEKKEQQGLGGEEKSSEDKGTGEKHIKTSGFKADGGNFDAAQPGAGKEADRLLEQKGIHKSGDSSSDAKKNDVSPARSGGSGEGKTKTSMGTKIKEKLHIGGKHKNGSD